MKTNGNKVGVILYSILCVAVFGFGGYVFLFENNAKSGTVFNFPASAENVIEYDINSENNSAESTASTIESEAVAVKTDGSVLGKIEEKYISPYTANTSYNNVYVKNNTDLNIDIKTLLEAKLGFNIDKNSSPQVLILHTHATESYMLQDKDYYTTSDLSRRNDENKNMIKLGEIVANKLNKSGIITIHDKTAHDYPSYNESYSRSAKTVNSYKSKYPSIKVVIDLHRDSVTKENGDKIKLTKTINGKKAAQIMLVMGSQSGNTKNFPCYQENLKLAFKIQSKAEEMYKGLARSLLLMPKNYNQSLTTGSVLIEIGTDANTIKEAEYSAELLGEILTELFKGL